MMKQSVTDSLQWVKKQLDVSLKSARDSLEEYLAAPDDDTQLRQCATEVHQVGGTLGMLELRGAAMLVEEMEGLLQSALDDPDQRSDQIYEPMLAALLALPDYLDYVLHGGPDQPLILMPQLNGLRAAAGKPGYAAATLFARSLTERIPSSYRPAGDAVQSEGLRSLAGKLRPRFQQALLAWFKEPAGQQHLREMLEVSGELHRATTRAEIFQLWGVVSAVLEALMQNGLGVDNTLKQLLGRVERQIKSLAEQDESAYIEAFPYELLHSLLYYVGQASSGGPQVNRIREAFALDSLLPSDEEIEQARQQLAAPNAELMTTVAGAVREDLATVKESLDVFLRMENAAPEELASLVETLGRVANTLGMLNLSGLQELIDQQAARLRAMSEGESEVSEAALLEIAGKILTVDEHLESDNLRDLGHGEEAAGAQSEEAGGYDQNLARAVFRESIRNLARVKDALVEYLDQPQETSLVEDAVNLLHEIEAGLGMLELPRPVELLTALRDYLRRGILEGGRMPSAATLELIADAVVSVEYYLEALQEGRSNPDSILDTTEGYVDLLRGGEPDQELSEAFSRARGEGPGEAPAAERQGSGEDAGEVAETLEIEPLEPGESDAASHQAGESPASPPEEASEPAAEQEQSSAGGQASATDEATGSAAGSESEKPAVVPLAEELDEEILDVFLEEAEEVRETFREYLPRWRDNPNDNEALVEVRRGFHTLKGSGRMVGAELVGEYAWSIENMLNRVIDQTLARSPEMMAVVEEAVEALPQLLAQLRGEAEPRVDVREIIRRAYAVVEGRLEDAAPAGGLPDSSAGASESGEESTEAAAAPAEESGEDTAAAAAEEEASQTAEQARPAEPETGAADEGAASEAGEGEAAAAPSGAGQEPTPRMDRVLYDIFRKECEGHLQVIADQFRPSEDDTDSDHVSDELIRALHTLNGSANMAEATGIAELARRLERLAKAMQQAGVRLTGDTHQLFEEATGAVESIVTALGDRSLPMPDHSELWARIEAYEHELLDEHHYPRQRAEPAPQTETAAAGGGEREDASTEAEEPDTPETMDPALTEVFIEEGADILAEAEDALQRWLDDPDVRDEISGLKRHLHTLKGNARVAGARHMGSLTHELETEVGRLARSKEGVSRERIELLIRVVDQLNHMMEQTKASEPVYPASGLLAALRGEEPGKPAAESAAPAPAAEPSEQRETGASEGSAEPAQQAAPAESTEDRGAAEPASQEPAPESAGEQPAASEPVTAAEETSPAEPSSAEPAPREEAAPEPAPAQRGASSEQLRVSADLLDTLLNNAGEVSIYHGRLEQQISSMAFNITEMDQTIDRLRNQLRELEMETEAQLYTRFGSADEETLKEQFDPLEFDRYTRVQQLSRSLMESVSDLTSVEELLENLRRESENLLLQQSRVTTELQDALMRTRMVPFSTQAARLRRVVRQAADELGKPARLELVGGQAEVDRNVLDRMLPPLEHLLRNAVGHGLESPELRRERGKSEEGTITLALHREGSEIVIVVKDDGAGLDLDKIRERAVERGLAPAEAELTDQDIIQFILEPGFSTAGEVTELAGRGVGMDVVDTEIKQLSGSLAVDTEPGRGTRFTVRLPFTLAISQGLLMRLGDETYAVPLNSIEGVVRMQPDEASAYAQGRRSQYEYGGEEYAIRPLAELLGAGSREPNTEGQTTPLVLVRAGEHRTALIVDSIIGSREMVVKSVGPQVNGIRGISGATILGDGSVVLILDLAALVRAGAIIEQAREVTTETEQAEGQAAEDEAITVMVVDDSITVRRVTTRLLESRDMNVITAKDGVDAVSLLQEHKPSIMLLDIEMPRMDGYELASHMRNDEHLKDVPIVMITSRVGQKHRSRALEIGVDEYLGKPYQESDLLETIRTVLQTRRGEAHA